MPSELCDGVFDITVNAEPSGKRNRVYLFTRGTPTLVDTGYVDTVDALFEGVRTVGVEPERVIITHGDRDHIGGFDAVVERYGVESWVPEQTTADLAHEPDHRYGDGDRIDPFLAVHVPGHAPDNHVLVDEAAGLVVTGDALSGSDRRGLPPGYFTLPPGSEDLDLALSSLEKLLDYEFETALVFHGTAVMEGASEKLYRYLNPI